MLQASGAPQNTPKKPQNCLWDLDNNFVF
jgi:hypothetical protein